MERTKWTERTFHFDIPEGWLPNILERLAGTEVRILAMVGQLPDEAVSLKPDDKWSIKEHIGHLTDLEELQEGRIDDFTERRPVLRAADMSNIKTREAGHNHRDLQALIREFAEKRHRLIARLQALDDRTQAYRAEHPRLQVMIKPVDLAFFTAEHDDHHLATIREIMERFSA